MSTTKASNYSEKVKECLNKVNIYRDHCRVECQKYSDSHSCIQELFNNDFFKECHENPEKALLYYP